MQLIFLPILKSIQSYINHSFSFQRRLYEYALHAVCSPLRVVEPDITTGQLATHVAKV